jgi:hypothetical protein
MLQRGASCLLRKAQTHALGARLQSTASEAARIVRFRCKMGDEHFGVFADPHESRAFIGVRHEDTGKLTLTKEVRDIDFILPPVDPPAIFCIGLNYLDHAKEVKMEAPQYPVVFSKSFNSLTGHLSAIVIPKVRALPLPVSGCVLRSCSAIQDMAGSSPSPGSPVPPQVQVLSMPVILLNAFFCL